MDWNKKDYQTTLFREKDGVVWIEFEALQGLPVKHAYSTRIGGVSTGVCESMNLRSCEWDSRANYEENMRRFCGALGVPFERIVASHQTHTTNVRVVTEADVPTGTLFGREFSDVDGLVTNVKNAVLVTSFADCIPLYLVDPVKGAIGMSHAGWRGTVGGIGRITVEAMEKAYGTNPTDVIACVGPGICQDCYEVSDDVYNAFEERFAKEQTEQIFIKKPDGKYQLDLWRANKLVLQGAGLKPEHIFTTDICTKCNSRYLFSHRAMGNKRGNQCGFLMLEG